MVEKDQWVFVVTQDPGGDEQFLGQYDEERDEYFIPAFLEKEEAEEVLNHLQRDKELKFEAQAIRFDDLCHRAAEKGFMVFLLSRTGDVLEKVRP